MFKVLTLLFVVLGINGCATVYYDSAPASMGGRYVAGAYDMKKAVFYCPATSAQDDCEKISVNIKN